MWAWGNISITEEHVSVATRVALATEKWILGKKALTERLCKLDTNEEATPLVFCNSEILLWCLCECCGFCFFFNLHLLAGGFDGCKVPKNCQTVKVNKPWMGSRRTQKTSTSVADPQVVKVKWHFGHFQNTHVAAGYLIVMKSTKIVPWLRNGNKLLL